MANAAAVPLDRPDVLAAWNAGQAAGNEMFGPRSYSAKVRVIDADTLVVLAFPGPPEVRVVDQPELAVGLVVTRTSDGWQYTRPYAPRSDVVTDVFDLVMLPKVNRG